MRKHIRFGAAIVLLVSPAMTLAQAPLAWKFRPRDKFYQETVTAIKQSIKVSSLGQDDKTETEQTSVSSFTVSDLLPNGSIVLEQRIEANKIKGGSAAAVAAPLLHQMQGASFRVTLGRDLQVVKFDGYEDLVRRLSGDDLASAKAVRSMLAEEAMKRSVEEAFAFLPNKPVKKGETWKRQHTLPLGSLGTLQAEHSYEYDGPEQVGGKTLDKILVSATLQYTPPQPGRGTFGLEITKGEIKAENARGVLYFDNVIGRLDHSEMSLRLTGSLTVKAVNQEYTLDMDQERNVKVRITDQPPKIE